MQFGQEVNSKFGGMSKDGYSESEQPRPNSSGVESTDSKIPFQQNKALKSENQGMLPQQSSPYIEEQSPQKIAEIFNKSSQEILQFFKSYKVHNADVINIEEIMSNPNVKLKKYK